MELKHLAIFVDVVNQFISLDFKHPSIKQLVKKEFNAWVKQSDKLVDSYKKYMDDETIVHFEEKVECIYEVVKVINNLPKEELENITNRFKEINDALSKQ